MRALFVDDDPDTRALAIRALSQEIEGLEPREAMDLESLDRSLAEAVPDILVTDYDLRWATGFDVFERVKSASPACATVMFTGTGNEELAVKAIKAGFDDYVVKGPRQLKRLAVSARLAYERGERGRSLEESRDLVLRELYHRLHNNLQIVISLLRLTERTIRDEGDRQRIADLRQRIQALSALQEEFYRSNDFRRVDFGSYLTRLAGGLVAFEAVRVALEVAADPLELPVDVAVPLGLVANELITNALKHAFPDGRPGTLSVSLRRENGSALLTIADDGPGFDPERASGNGLGRKLVHRLIDQINGSIAYERLPTGMACHVTTPLGAAR
ncbi:MAG TPA: histidine kinase dimerization/phosphoacceptor domain -containing protein [Microvirga sp.]|jgi:two-component sensor histidine kinase